MTIQHQLEQTTWIDPMIPISLSKHIRSSQGELFPDLYDQLVQRFTPQQTQTIKELIRDLCDLSNLEFHECEQLALRLVRLDNQKSLGQQREHEELGDPIDPEWEAVDPRSIAN
jgi:hypothetical protein